MYTTSNWNYVKKVVPLVCPKIGTVRLTDHILVKKLIPRTFRFSVAVEHLKVLCRRMDFSP